MIIELAHFSLILSMFMALVVGILGISAKAEITHTLKAGSFVIFTLALLSFLLLINGFLNDDFSVRYIVAHANRHLDTFYKIGAAWGGHEGSLLLWGVLLVAWQSALSLQSKAIPERVYTSAIGILSLIAVGFFLFILLTSNPFERLLPPPANGADLNPLLQDVGLILHPPLLYIGYVGFAPVFALTIAALMRGKIDAHWARYLRPWTLMAWVFLTLGIVLGSMWAYAELGWGGWWFWDPVENASLMPWLASTALLHSLAIAEKRGIFKHWTVLMAIATFSLSMLGTFLVRSGILTSVHAFATDPLRGVFILIFLAIITGFALWIYIHNSPKLYQETHFALFSRDNALLLNNVFLIVICATVLLGTLFPLLTDVLRLGKFSVGAPYFNRVLTPIWVVLLAILPVGILLRWKKDRAQRIRPIFLWCIPIALISGSLMPFLFGKWKWGVALVLSLACLVIMVSIWDSVSRFIRQRRLPASLLGMHLAHLGVAIFTIGTTVVSHYDVTVDRLIYPQKSIDVNDYKITFRQLEGQKKANYQTLIGHFDVTRNGQFIAHLKAEKRQYTSSEMPMTEAAIARSIREDVYLSMGELRGDNPEKDPWTIRLYIKPLMNWVWAGCLLMALGGIVAATDRRYRRKAIK